MFHILVATFGRVLLLLAGFTLPITDMIMTENIIGAVACFDGSTVREEAIRSTTINDVLLKGVHELLLGAHGIDVADLGFDPTVELAFRDTGFDVRCIRIEGIGSDIFITACDVVCGKGRLIMFLGSPHR